MLRGPKPTSNYTLETFADLWYTNLDIYAQCMRWAFWVALGQSVLNRNLRKWEGFLFQNQQIKKK